MKNLSRSCGYRITNLNRFQVTTFQHTILITQLTGSHNLTGLHILRITCINHDFLTPDTIVFFHELKFIYNLLFQETSITRFVNLYLTHHLTHDNLKMLIIDFHTLQTVYILNFIHDIFLYSRRTFNSQDIRRSNSTVRQRSTCTYIVIFLYKDLLRQCYQVFLNLTSLRSYDNLTVTTLDLTHCHLTVDFRNDSRIGRVTSFKQFSNTRKTTRDITCLTYGTRNLHDNLTGLHFLTIFDDHVTTYRQVISTNQITVFCQDMSRRYFCLIFGFNNNNFTKTCSFIRFNLISNVFYHALKFDLTGCFSNDYSVERVPLSNHLAFFYQFTIAYIQR